MKTKRLFCTLALCGATFLFSCKKGVEVNPNDASKYVRLQSMHFTPGENGYSSARLITFNEKGEPDRSIANVYSTGDPNEVFRYNTKGQLKERILFFGEEPDSYEVQGNNVFVLYTYAYDNKGRIVSDTNHYIGGYAIGHNGINGPDEAMTRRSIQYYNDYTYDAKGRIISVKNTFVPYPYVSVTNYEYDNNGNLKGFAYDNKYNPVRLSKVLSHLTCNFSVNNRIGEDLAYTYNQYNLPTNATTSGSYLFGLLYGPGTVEVSYLKK
jgi:hypothetical protein